MSLPPRADLTWAQEIGVVAEEYMNASVRFFERVNSQPVERVETKARVQHLRAPLDVSSPTGYATKRIIRLQIPLDATTGGIAKGWIVQIDGGNDPTLELIALTVQSAVNSSWAALRTVECVSELALNVPRVP